MGDHKGRPYTITAVRNKGDHKGRPYIITAVRNKGDHKGRPYIIAAVGAALVAALLPDAVAASVRSLCSKLAKIVELRITEFPQLA
jgi:hypothetical protein